MYSVFSIIRMEFLREFSNRSTFIFFLVLPLVFTATIGGQLGEDAGAATSPSQPIIAVLNEDTHPFSQLLLDVVAANEMTLTPITAVGDEPFILHIPADFSANALNGTPSQLRLQVDSNNSQSLVVQEAVAAAERYGEAVLQQLQATAVASQSQTGPMSQAALSQFYASMVEQLRQMRQTPPVETAVVWAGFAQGQTPRSVTDGEQASAGQMITWVLVTLLGTSAVLVNERVSGTLSRLFIMPTSNLSILSGKLLARFLMGLMQMSLLFLGGLLLFGIDWGKSPFALILVSVTFALAITGLGLLLATFVKNGLQAGSINTGLAMAMAALGGAWWPLEITPTWYQQAMHVLPTTWAMKAYTKILLYGSSVSQLLPELLALTLFGLLFFGLGVWRFRQIRV